MTISKLTAGAKGTPGNSNGSDIATAVNALIDASVATYAAVAEVASDLYAITTTDVSEGANQYHTTERSQDAAASLFTGGEHSGLSFAYDDSAAKINATINPSQQFDAIALAGLPQTAGAPAGYGDLASAVNYLGKSLSRSAPIANQTISAADISVISGNVVLEYGLAPNGMPGVKCTFSNSSAIKFTKATGQFFSGEAQVVMLGGKNTFVDSITMRVYQNFASNQQFFRQTTFATNPVSNYREQGGAFTVHNTALGFGSSGTPSATFTIDDMRMTLAPTAGQTGVLWIFGFSTTFAKRKSRVCVMFDDGYDSLITLGVSPFASRGIPTTVAVVPSGVDLGLAGYATLPQLKSYVGQGNAIVAHDVGNLTTDFQTVADAIASAKSTIEWVALRGLNVPYYSECYVWPAAASQATTGQLDYLDGLLSLGVNIARGANPIGANAQQGIGGLTKYNRLVMPIIGHTWAGTTAAESTNISNIVSTINSISTNGGIDVFLMFHKVVPDSTPDGSMALSIRVSDLNTLAAALKTNIDNGLLEAVTMPQLAASNDTFWNRI